MPPRSSHACSPARTARPEPVRVVVVVPPQVAEEVVDPAAGPEAEEVGEPRGLRRLRAGRPSASASARATRRGHREELVRDVDEPEEERLLPLAGGPVDHHRSGSICRASLRRASARRSAGAARASRTRRSAGRRARANQQAEVPARVERRRPSAASRASCRPGPSGSMSAPATWRCLSTRLARHEEVHDLRRALEDQVDAEVAHRALDAHRRLTARRERRLRLVAAAAADLHGVVDDPPGADGVPLLRRRGLEPDVVAAAVGERAGEVRDRLHREGASTAMSAILWAIASCLPIAWPHCTRACGPLAADLEARPSRRPPPRRGARAGRC